MSAKALSQVQLSTITGSIEYAQFKAITGNVKQGHVKIYAYAKGWFGDTLISKKEKVNSEGKFTISFNKSYKNIELRVVQTQYPFADRGVKLIKQHATLQKVSATYSGKEESINWNISLADKPLSLSALKLYTLSKRSSPELSYYLEFMRSGFMPTIKAGLAVGLSCILTASRIQKLFDLGAPELPKKELTAKSLLESLTNEVLAVDFEKNGNLVTWNANFDGYEMDSDNLPNVKVTARIESHDKPLALESIETQYSKGPVEITKIGDSEDKLKLAINRAFVAFGTKGEAEVHLAKTHLYAGIIVREFDKHIKSPDHPLLALLGHHTKTIEEINRIGNATGTILGPNSVLAIGSLTGDSLLEYLVDYISSICNWKDFKLEEPLNESHTRQTSLINWYAQLKQYFDAELPEVVKQIENNVQYKNELINWSKGCCNKMVKFPTFVNETGPIDTESLSQFFTRFIGLMTIEHTLAHENQQAMGHIGIAPLAPQNKSATPEGKYIYGGNMNPFLMIWQLLIFRSITNFKSPTYGDSAVPAKEFDAMMKTKLPGRDPKTVHNQTAI